MTDIYDQATHQEQLATEVALSRTRKAAAAISMVNETGRCLNCDEPVSEPNRRWCDRDCLRDWQMREHISNG